MITVEEAKSILIKTFPEGAVSVMVPPSLAVPQSTWAFE